MTTSNKARAFVFLALLIAAGVLAVVLQRRDRPGHVAREEPDLPKSDLLARLRIDGRVDRRFSTLYDLVEQEPVRGWRVKIEVFRFMETDAASVLVEEGIIALEALYADALSPYPGDVSRRIVHDEESRPRFHESSAGAVPKRYFTLYASRRLGYGVTSRELLAYRSLLGWIYCEESRKLFKVRLFAPLGTAWHELETEFLTLECG